MAAFSKTHKDIKDVINNVKEIFTSDSNLGTLMDFERVLDELDLYVFKHWKEGELVQGPVYEKYFVSCTFMWPYKRMPDPAGGERLLSYDCEVYYEKSMLTYPKRVDNPDDYKPGTKMPKMVKSPIWLVTIVMPKKLMTDIQRGSVEIEGEELDLEDLEKGYEDGIDENSTDEAANDIPQADLSAEPPADDENQNAPAA